MTIVAARNVALVALGLILPSLALADARQELVSAFGKAFDREAYRIEVDSPGQRGGQAQIDVQLPDRFHMRSAEGEFIIHPQGTWAQHGGQWMRMPMDMSSMVAAYAQPSREEAEAELTQVERIGEEQVRGCASTLYRYRNSEGTAVAAVCRETGLPVRIQTEGGEPVTLYYDFDTAIDIRPPN
ncbi:hypothetical protein [Alkalisalibacterium limincola]|uniref:Outer membrane lipoprotein carrier protein LolA n=1 Tax=Alkalisalibacterium limincola TaxID=2699169 RepID=A0A5C8KZV5_9GAMM|nr:hypothetical protein [Alkalisalibacterium limincola]TXK65681.1 hypothetical protein FU658_00720 [Alkalisalibacterium limincola]